MVSYWKSIKLLNLSKLKKNQNPAPTIDDIRPIQINSIITKIIEKLILSRIGNIQVIALNKC